MAKVNICNVVVKDNPALFEKPFQFEITFECIEDLNEDLEWKIVYVGSAESEDYDQILDTVVVGPIIAGRHMFVFEADPPKIIKIPKEDAVGVTVVLLTCFYRNQEFIRVGYYVNNEYTDPELKENPPMEPVFSKLQRNILATCPRVTRFKIDWGGAGEEAGGSNENVPPTQNTHNESNQMAIGDGASCSSNGLPTNKPIREETMDGPPILSKITDTASNCGGPSAAGLSNGNAFGISSDSNGMDILGQTVVSVGGGGGSEPMQM